MKLDTTIKEKLIDIVSTAHSIGISALVIDADSIRGVGEKKALILLDTNTPDISELGSIAVNRVNLFNSRISLMNGKTMSMEAVTRTEDNGDVLVEKFILKDKKTTVDFKCCRAGQIKAPKILKSAMIYQFDISSDSLQMMMQANSAMNNDNLSFNLEDNVVYFKLTDNSGDMLKHVISDEVNILDDEATKTFFFNYDKKILLPLIKMAFKNGADTLSLQLTSRGFINLTINSLNIFVAPEI